MEASRIMLEESNKLKIPAEIPVRAGVGRTRNREREKER